MCVHLYIHKHSAHTVCKQKFVLDAINSLTALIYIYGMHSATTPYWFASDICYDFLFTYLMVSVYLKSHTPSDPVYYSIL